MYSTEGEVGALLARGWDLACEAKEGEVPGAESKRAELMRGGGEASLLL